MQLENIILKSDRYYEYMTQENKDEIVKKAHFIVDKISGDYNILKIKKEFDSNSFKIIKCENKNEDFLFRARMEIGHENKIYIYEDTINRSLKKFENMTYDEIYNMYLAHEFFHFLEYKKIVNTDYYINKNFLLLNQKVKISALSEMCANLFAQSIVNSKVSPMELDLKEIDYEI